MEYFLVGIGGALGSLARYGIGSLIAKGRKTAFPISTFIINITGTYLLGVCMTIPLSHNLLLLFGTGFLGAYTTFSTFMYEGFYLFKTHKVQTIFYLSGSVFVGIFGFVFGVFSVQNFT